MRWSPPPGGSVVFEYDPAANGPFQAFYGTIWSCGEADQAVKECVRVRLARDVGCETCQNLRFGGARDQGLTEADLDLVGAGFESTALSPRYKAALRWADAVAGQPAIECPAAIDDVEREFSRAELAELTLTTGIAVSFAKAMKAWGPQPKIPITLIPTPSPDAAFVQPDEQSNED